MGEEIKYQLGEDQIPEQWYNILADAPSAATPGLHPGTHQPLGPEDLAPLFPMDLIMQEVSTERYIEIPEQVRNTVPPVPTHAAVPSASPGAGARYAGPHLLQVRGREPGRQSQAEHRTGPGVLQQESGHASSGHGNRRRAVGLRARDGVRILRPGVHGLYGAGQLRTETVPSSLDGDLRGDRAVQPDRSSRKPASASGPSSPIRREVWESPSARRWKMPPRTTTPTIRWEACSTMSSCTRR